MLWGGLDGREVRGVTGGRKGEVWLPDLRPR